MMDSGRISITLEEEGSGPVSEFSITTCEDGKAPSAPHTALGRRSLGNPTRCTHLEERLLLQGENLREGRGQPEGRQRLCGRDAPPRVLGQHAAQQLQREVGNGLVVNMAKGVWVG